MTKIDLSAETVAEWVARYEAGVAMRAIADTTPYSYGFIRKTLLRHGVRPRTRGGSRPGERHRRKEVLVTVEESATRV